MMTDFERNPERSNGRTRSEGDPLLELTRLFGARSRPSSPQNNAWSEKTAQQDKERQAGGSQSGVSMSGNIMMIGGGYEGNMLSSAASDGANPNFVSYQNVATHSFSSKNSNTQTNHHNLQEGQPSASEAVEASLSEQTIDEAVEAPWKEVSWEEMESASPMPTSSSSSSELRADFNVGTDRPHGAALYVDNEQERSEEMAWLPLDESWDDGAQEGLSYPTEDEITQEDVASLNVEDPAVGTAYDEQLFHALKDDLTSDNIVNSETDAPLSRVNSDLTVADTIVPPGFSSDYFGYGQSVQVDITASARAPFKKAKIAHPQQDDAKLNVPSKQKNEDPAAFNGNSNPVHQSSPRQAPPLERVIKEETGPRVNKITVSPPAKSNIYSNETTTAPEPQNPFADFPEINAPLDFDETLHDFDLTIQREKRRRTRLISPSPAPIPAIEPTDAFELPPADYNDTVLFASERDDFSTLDSSDQRGDFFADSASPSLSSPTEKQQNIQQAELIEELSGQLQNGIYNWNTQSDSSAIPQKQKTPNIAQNSRKLYAFLVILLLVSVSFGGYFVYHFYTAAEIVPVLIKASPGDFKNRPETSDNTQTTPGMAVYNQDGATALPQTQSQLLDGSESPLNMDLLTAPSITDEAAANISKEDINNLDPVDASILQATSRAIPLHLVPSVTIELDNDGNVAEIPHSNGTEEVLNPAGDYRQQIIAKINEQEQLSRQIPSILQPENEQIPSVGQDFDLANIEEEPPFVETARAARPAGETLSSSLEDETDQVQNSEEDSVQNVASLNVPATIPSKPDRPILPTTRPTPQQPEIIQANTPVDERFYVQISSQPSQQAAIESAADIGNRFASLIGKNQVVIVPADIPGRGIYYRVRVLVSDQTEAVKLCEGYKAAGGSCFVGR